MIGRMSAEVDYYVKLLEREFGHHYVGIGLKSQPKISAEIRASESTPINVRLLERQPNTNAKIKPRRYQEELYLRALEQNVIIYLGTGLGKTYITVLFLRSGTVADQIHHGKKVVFLAPTVDLIMQQAEYIHDKVPHRVKVYCGRSCNMGLHIDKWDVTEWNKEFADVDILFMIPEIFSSAISTSMIKWEQVSVVIFDECHHAETSKKERNKRKKGHPYSQILRHYKQILATDRPESKPRLIGLTASLVKTMPKDPILLTKSIQDLESKFEAKCVTDITANESKPRFMIYCFNESGISPSNDTILRLLYSYAEVIEESLEISKLDKILKLGPKNEEEFEVLAYANRLKCASSGFSIKPNSFHKVLRQLAAIRANSGLWTFNNICYNLTLAMSKTLKSPTLSNDVKQMYVDFITLLAKFTQAVGKFLGPYESDILLNYSQPKLQCLLQVLKSQYLHAIQEKDKGVLFSCIVFVKSRIEVKAICGWLKSVSESIPGYEFMRVGYAIGMAATMVSKWSCITMRTSKEQSAMLEKFRRGELNVIITTSVLEEGIDLPVCSTVIRYDPANNFRVHVQSRGRARQRSSYYIEMCSTVKKQDTQSMLDKFQDFEVRVKDYLQEGRKHVVTRPFKMASINVEDKDDDEDEDTFMNRQKGVLINSTMAKIILHMYCSRLSRRYSYSDGLTFERELDEHTRLYKTTLFLPPGCPVKNSVSGFPRSTVDRADNSAAVNAFRVLHDVGELDECGVPIKMTEEHIHSVLGKHNLQPDFSPLDRSLEGSIEKVGNHDVFVFPQKLFNLGTCLSRGYSRRTYKLYLVNFKSSGLVREDTRHWFEQSAIGLIVDSARDSSSWPQKIFSHYGEFSVDYELLNGFLEIDSYDCHRKYSSYTLGLINCFWKNIGKINKEDFIERCQFYTVPIDSKNIINETSLDKFFRTRHCDKFRVDDVVRKNPFFLDHRESSRIYIIRAIHYQMSPHSIIPGRRETFYEQARQRYGNEVVLKDLSQPIIEVVPIASQIANESPIKKKGVDHQSRSEFYMAQILDLLYCDIPTAYQAYNLPPIVYRIYLSTLASDLNDRFVRATCEYRESKVCPPKLPEPDHQDMASSVDEQPYKFQDEDQSEDEMTDADSEIGQSEEEFYQSSDDDMQSDTLSHDCESDSIEPETSNTFRDIMCRQKLKLTEPYGDIEKWDLDDYNPTDLKRFDYEYQEHSSYQKFIDTSPRFYNTVGELESATSTNISGIASIISQFRMGILSQSDLYDNHQVSERPGNIVDLNIETPIKFDRPLKPIRDEPRDLHFIEALTLRKAGDCRNLEALENVGDSYLKYSVSVILFQCVDYNEGLLSLARSRLVGNKYLNHLAKKNRLGVYAIANKFDPKILGSALGAHESCGNRMRDKDLSDMVESIIGACLIYRSEFEAIMAMKWLGLDIFKPDSFQELHETAVVFGKARTALYDDASGEFYMQSKKCLDRFQSIIRYEFIDSSHLVQAFTHASAPRRCTDSYERLEFIGDAILDFLVTITLYDANYTTDPGQLTSSRSAIVNNCTFARLVIEYKYDIYIQHANQELYDELNNLNEQAKLDPEFKFLDDFKFDRITKTLADVFESVAGAIYLDSGCSLDTVYRIYYPIMKKTIDAEIMNPTKNNMVRLYELFPGKDRIVFEFLTPSTGTCETNETSVCTKLSIHGLEPFYGEGLTRRQSKLRAVAIALDNLPSREEITKLNLEYRRILEKHDPVGSLRTQKRNIDVPYRGRGHFHGHRGRRTHSGAARDQRHTRSFADRSQSRYSKKKVDNV